jgi:hypothetical protein
LENHKEQIEAIEGLIQKAKIKLDSNMLSHKNLHCKLQSSQDSHIFSKTLKNEDKPKDSRNKKAKIESSYNSK